MNPFKFRMRDFRAPSGLRIVVEEDHSAPVAGVVTVVGVGSSSDPAGKEGIAHFVEHMAFRMKPFGDTPATMWELLPESGVAEFNASTGLDATVYYEFGPKDALPRMLHLEGARMAQPLVGIDPKTVDTEREVVRNELRERGETAFTSAAFGWMQAALFPADHPYHRPVIGTHESLSATRLEDLQSFARQHYRLDNMTMVVIGDFQLEEMGKMLTQTVPFLYGDADHPMPVVPARLSPQPAPPPDPPAHDMFRYEGPVATPELWIGWTLPGAYRDDSALIDFVAWLMDGLLIGAVQEDDDIASVDTSPVAGIHSTMLICRVLLRDGVHPERSAEHVLNTLSKAWGVSDRRAQITKFGLILYGPSQAANEMALATENILTRAEETARMTHFVGSPQIYSRILAAIGSIDWPKIQKYAYQYVNRDRARVLYITPLPASKRAVGGTGLGAGEPDDGAEARVPDHSPDEIRRLAKPPGFASFATTRLKNGLEVVIARHPTIPAVTVQLGLHGGRGAADPGVAEVTSYLSRPHSTRHGSLLEFGALLRSGIGEDQWETQIRAGSGNLRDVLAILYDRVSSMEVPTELPPLAEKWLYPLLHKLEAHPELQGDRAFWRALFGNHAYGRRATVDQMEKVEVAAVERWMDRVFVPRNGVVAIVGDVEVDAAQKLAVDWLGDWTSRGEALPAPTPADIKPSPLNVAITHRPAASQGELRLACRLTAMDPRDAVLYELMAKMAADRLFKRVRIKLGASYGIRPHSEVLRGGTAYVELSGNINNASLSPALAVIKEYWDALARGEFDEKEMNRVRYELALEFNLRFATSQRIADEIVLRRNLDWPLESVDQYGQHLASITKQELTRAFGGCHESAVLSIIGDHDTIEQALTASGWRGAH